MGDDDDEMAFGLENAPEVLEGSGGVLEMFEQMGSIDGWVREVWDGGKESGIWIAEGNVIGSVMGMQKVCGASEVQAWEVGWGELGEPIFCEATGMGFGSFHFWSLRLTE